MKIISKFRDYYDCMQSYHSDDIVFVRNETFEEYPDSQRKDDYTDCLGFGCSVRDKMKKICDIRYRIITVGFCGKLYVCVNLSVDRDISNPYVSCEEYFFYTPESIKNFLETKIEDKFWKLSVKTESRWTKPFSPDYFSSKFSLYENDTAKKMLLSRLFAEKNVPLFIAYPKGIRYNGSLKDVEFFRLFEPSICFQELSMYIGGVMANTNPSIPEISNEDMIQAKGFDLKFSFRKEKTTK